MVAGIFHEGSGLGDQLFRYITVRTLAEEKGYTWSLVGNFKGEDFLPIERHETSEGEIKFHYYGTERPKNYLLHNSYKRFHEKDVRDANGIDIRSYDPEINFVEDNTVIDGSFEDDKYWRHNLDNINKWLAVEPLDVPDDVCVIGFRGGEYASNPDLFLPQQYYREAMAKILTEHPGKIRKFEVHTDDPELAKKFFGDIPVEIIENNRISHSKHSNMGFNWRSMRYAKYAIIPNSAFFILPRILSKGVTIAPRYWARRNTKVWARPACYYKEFQYI